MVSCLLIVSARYQIQNFMKIEVDHCAARARHVEAECLGCCVEARAFTHSTKIRQCDRSNCKKCKTIIVEPRELIRK
jgi:hypothetical protein